MQKKRSIKIIAVVMILVLICVSITYFKNDSKVVLATTKEFNIENLQDNEHMHVEVDSSGDKVPVPNGYVGSKATGENEIDTGYVIYEGTEEVNDSNVVEAQKTRNQYVWIPVPDASTMYGTDENGKKWGKLYTFTTETGVGIDPVTGTKPLNWSESDGIMKINKNSYREPDIVSYWNNLGRYTLLDEDSRLKASNIDSKTTNDFLNQLEKNFNNMIDSVEKYGGFYIGRYETGNLSQSKAVIVKENSDIDKKLWYKSYKMCNTLGEDKENIETGMIWGCQWDRTLIWLIESGNKTITDICNSKEWGNHYGTWEAEKVSGYSENWKAANIYDLAGNMNEWTMENCYSTERVTRGGAYWKSASTVSKRGMDKPTGSNSYGVSAGCRAMLYIK